MSTSLATVTTVARSRVQHGPWQNAHTASWATHSAIFGWVACNLADAEHHASQQRTVGRVVDDK